MARVDVTMPQMGESIAEGTLSKWLKKVGDEVKRDEPIFEISTDKVDAEIPAPSAGVLAEILVQEGQTVPVQTVVARLETEKGALVGAGAAVAPAAGAARGAPPAVESTPAPAEPRHPAAPTAIPSRTAYAPSPRRSCAKSPPSTASSSRACVAPASPAASPRRTSCSSSTPAAPRRAQRRPAHHARPSPLR